MQFDAAPLVSYSLLDSSLSAKALFVPTTNGFAAVNGTRIYASSARDGGFVVLDNSLQTSRTVRTPSSVEGIAANSAGTAYVIDTNGVLYVFDSNGSLAGQRSLGILQMDLAPDGCTLWYIDVSLHVQSYNVCTNQPGAPVATSQRLWFARGLNGGGFIGGFGSNLFVFNSSGTLVRTISIPGSPSGVFDGAFSPDSQFIYLSLRVDDGSSVNPSFAIEKLRIEGASAAALTQTDNLHALTISVFGEQLPTAEELAAAGVPMTPSLLAALAAALALIALRRIG